MEPMDGAPGSSAGSNTLAVIGLPSIDSFAGFSNNDNSQIQAEKNDPECSENVPGRGDYAPFR